MIAPSNRVAALLSVEDALDNRFEHLEGLYEVFNQDRAVEQIEHALSLCAEVGDCLEDLIPPILKESDHE